MRMQKKEAEGEEEKVQRKEYLEEIEAKNNPYISDSMNEAQHTTEERNPRSVGSTPVMENADSILNVARNSTLNMFNFQKWMIENISIIQNKQRYLDYKIEQLIKDRNTKGKEDAVVDTSEVEDKDEIQDWSEKDMIKRDLKHLEDVIRIIKEKGEVDNEIINRITKTEKGLVEIYGAQP